MKNCEFCDKEFSPVRKLQRFCTKSCGNKMYHKVNRVATTARHRAVNLQKRYGVTIEQYDEMLAQQNGLCAICNKTCGTGRNLAVDHDHATGEVRGLLCAECNTGLGKFKDSLDLLTGAMSYLIKSENVIGKVVQK